MLLTTNELYILIKFEGKIIKRLPRKRGYLRNQIR